MDGLILQLDSEPTGSTLILSWSAGTFVGGKTLIKTASGDWQHISSDGYREYWPAKSVVLNYLVSGATTWALM